MNYTLTAALILSLSGGAALAAGDAEAGKKVFNQCQTCHVVADADGNILAGKNAKTGPNLYGIIGRAAATYPDFKYGDGIIAAGAAGLVWDETNLVAYVQDPAGLLETVTGDSKVKSKMSFKIKKEEDAQNVVAFLASLQPAATN
jgi:cytochrome c